MSFGSSVSGVYIGVRTTLMCYPLFDILLQVLYCEWWFVCSAFDRVVVESRLSVAIISTFHRRLVSRSVSLRLLLMCFTFFCFVLFLCVRIVLFKPREKYLISDVHSCFVNFFAEKTDVTQPRKDKKR